MQNLVSAELQQQIGEKERANKVRMEREKLTDAVNMGHVNEKLHQEKLEKLGNRRQEM